MHVESPVMIEIPKIKISLKLLRIMGIWVYGMNSESFRI